MSRKGPSTIGVATFDTEKLLTDPEIHQKARDALSRDDLQSAIKIAFSLSDKDKYTYHASSSITLEQAQQAVNAGGINGLCAWYPSAEVFQNDEDGSERRKLEYPSPAEVQNYISLFDPSKSGANLLKGFKANAKKNSLQSGVAENLLAKRYVSPEAGIVVPKAKKGHANVYADFWAWSCMCLRWGGPNVMSAQTSISHACLIIFMHHFGCVCPSYESLEIVRAVSRGRTVLDVGSGNGYWTFMLRRHGVDVVAVDNGQSTWRTLWIEDTINEDGTRYIKQKRKGGKDDVLLMVYPVVGLEFTVSVLDAYKGDIVCVVGTQNGNGYTGFRDEMIDSWMARERKDFERVVQVPLPSFAGKDDALFVFRRKQPKEGVVSNT
ncbi:hypothetical protein LTR64_002995 [Lithohypha guttulata]|uniref:uncharacterized protein n=1 Tax=Lithohypha guttulata TaxID=1690604 RepID=UPI002DE049CC|nr:hypothetical protein LTR51_000781 [Lithohypha guttulata]